jgi:outer membrane protein OmpA-like peptidoglycan-associated protein
MSARRRAITAVALMVTVAGCQSGGNVSGKKAPAGSPEAMATDLAAKVAQVVPTIQGAFSDLDEPQEIELGRAVGAAVGARYRLLRDRELTRYVALVGNAVAAHSERPDLRYYFAVLDASEVNAFAAPGGYVFITRGALAVMKDEAMLAGVLGHEIAHIARRHAVETLKAQKRKELAILGLREATAQSSVRAFSGAIAAAADTVAEQVVLTGYSRAEESEADRLGFAYATGAGYDPAGLRDFLSTLIDRGSRDSVIGTFLSTHPGTEDRLTVQDDLLKSHTAGGRRNPQRFAQVVPPRLLATTRPPAVPVTAVGPAVAARPPQPPAPPPAVRPTSEFARAMESTGRYVSYGIQFDAGSDRLRAESTPTLRMIADALRADPSLRLHIEGHTDATGNVLRNVDLSRRRAEAVKATLVSRFNVAGDRLTTSGIGAARPLDSNDTPAGRAANRRVEFVKQ